MKFTLLLYSNEANSSKMDDAAKTQSLAAFQGYIAALKEAGVFISTDWLSPSFTATTLTLQGGSLLVQDGPYTATKEQLGGYFAIEVASLDDALSWAQKCPVAAFGYVEVRPSAFG